MLDLVEDWKVRDDMVSSDHNAITFGVRLQKGKGTSIHRTTRLYNTKKANWSQFHEKLAQLNAESNINKIEIEKIESKKELDQTIEKYTDLITQTCMTTIPKKKTNEVLTSPWWSEELAKLKKVATTMKRRTRCAAPVRRAKAVDEYLKAKEKYENEVRIAKTESWKEFCAKQDKEGMWEGIYRVIGRTMKRHEDLPLEENGRVMDAEDSARLLAKTFYPEDSEKEDNADHRRTRKRADSVNGWAHDEPHDPPFTMEELRATVGTFNPKKAPGVDGFTADICKQAILLNPEVFLALANQCMVLGHFPTIWKEATVVVLRKPGKDNYASPKSYRPIGLLPVLGKILEKMVVGRIKWHILPKLSSHQYGFMPQKSTEDALYVLLKHIRYKLREKKLITLVSLDIEGAFDSAWWPIIKTRLAEEQCPINIRRMIDSYLTDRKVRVRYAGKEISRQTTKGCVQGSIGGPVLWNLILDPLLKLLETRGDYCQAFADDVVLVFDGKTALEVERRANAALSHIQAWGVLNKLKFAPHKTQAMVITNKLKYDTPRLSMGGVDIGMSEEMKILGLTIDHKLTFNSHAANVCKKALNVYKQLSRAARVSWGLNTEIIRTIYTATVEPIILYAASVWAPATQKLCMQKHLNAVQRGFAQKLCKAYRTVSLNSALVLAGILPLDLRVQEAAALYEAKRGVPRPALKDREVEKMASFSKSPHPAKHMRLEFLCLEDQAQVDTHSDHAVRMFTDGSRIEGKVGAALSVWNMLAETKAHKFKLSSYCTVYQAELLAICKATEEILKSKELNYGIYSDSKSSLEAITNHASIHPLALKIRDNLRAASNQDKTVALYWVKAHAGLVGNERADELAKHAALGVKTKSVYDSCPVSFVKRQIRIETLSEWNSRYTNSDTAATTKMFFPNAIEAFKTVRQVKPTGVLTQVLTGHGGFSEYLSRFKCKEDPSCLCEPGKYETAAHVIFECPIFGRERYETEQELGVNLKVETANQLITNKKSRFKFIAYCIDVANKVIVRNKTDI